MINDWQRVTPENLPPEDVMVETKIDDDKGERNVCLLFASVGVVVGITFALLVRKWRELN